MVQHLKGLQPNTRHLATREAMHKLGLDGQPDPENRLRASVASKLQTLRNLLDHDQDPLQGNKALKAKWGTYKWRAWLRSAFMTFPDRTGTLDDAAAFLEADPSIAPLLDRRPELDQRDIPRWKISMTKMRSRYPEFESTGARRGLRLVFRFNEQVAEDLAAACKVKAPKCGVSGLPHLGKES
ncbi:hypothetical protein TSOC_013269 [Tetrabaena socialis]|uniref:Uncharacterized protein n=1 Tax=Tetrabaena socialis TaxID=47790 RepID=A0A2J7ZKU3_9CHLO|nr:hypothetical protein TSOC_013269 [Tetrabaena socialis]|eukprot:PNH00882.1 hypothetical protein TSOC_013269 [Tetrabaena socialis]